jgi:hypothetical protein
LCSPLVLETNDVFTPPRLAELVGSEPSAQVRIVRSMTG